MRGKEDAAGIIDDAVRITPAHAGKSLSVAAAQAL